MIIQYSKVEKKYSNDDSRKAVEVSKQCAKQSKLGTGNTKISVTLKTTGSHSTLGKKFAVFLSFCG